MKKHIQYLSTISYPTYRASGTQIKNMCQSLSQCQNVTLISPSLQNPFTTTTQALQHQSLPSINGVKHAPSILKSISFFIWTLTFYISAVVYLMFKNRKQNLVYTREPYAALITTLLGFNTILELHDFPHTIIGKIIHKFIMDKNRKVIVINQQLKKMISTLTNNIKIHVAPSSVSKEWLVSISKPKARKNLNLDNSKKYIVYTGSIGLSKGVQTIIDTINHFPNDKYQFMFAGRVENNHLLQQLKNSSNSTYLGVLPHSRIKTILAAADILLLPNSDQHLQFSQYTSPMKLFEYMASRRPIIATNIKAIQEYQSYLTLVPPQDPQALAVAIKQICSNTQDSSIKQKIEDAYQFVCKNTWDHRTKKILEFIYDH